MSVITRRTAYAERILSYIARSKKDYVPSSDIISDLKIPKSFSRQILLTLQREGILKSVKGARGGFKLAIPKEEISFCDVMRVFQGELVIIDCMTGKMDCTYLKGCQLKKELEAIQKYVNNRLKKFKFIDC